jgi:hypothetical protein
MKELSRKLSATLLISALAAVAVLLVFDLWHNLGFTTFHQRAGGLSVLFIGASYICLQLSTSSQLRDKLKRIPLGVGFCIWGSESFMPPGHIITVMDNLVVLIFVTDLSFVILDSLRRKDNPVP